MSHRITLKAEEKAFVEISGNISKFVQLNWVKGSALSAIIKNFITESEIHHQVCWLKNNISAFARICQKRELWNQKLQLSIPEV